MSKFWKGVCCAPDGLGSGASSPDNTKIMDEQTRAVGAEAVAALGISPTHKMIMDMQNNGIDVGAVFPHLARTAAAEVAK